MVEIVKLVRDQYGELHVDGKLRTWKRVAQLLREESVQSSGRLSLCHLIDVFEPLLRRSWASKDNAALLDLRAVGESGTASRRGPMKKSKKARTRGRMVKELDDAARIEVFERDGHVCVRCSHPERNVQWSHVIGRRHKCVRWEADNALTLCAGCHMWWHEYPTLSGEWFRKNWPERHERILRIFNAGGKVTMKDLEVRVVDEEETL